MSIPKHDDSALRVLTGSVSGSWARRAYAIVTSHAIVEPSLRHQGAYGTSHSPHHPAYGTTALAAAEAPTEFVSVTDTEAMLDTLPLMVNGIDSENCEPVFSDAEL